jgi:SAM-dependent methyltransferase
MFSEPASCNDGHVCFLAERGQISGVVNTMSEFSPAWLALREPVDHRSRSLELAQALVARFQQRSELTIVDLGCGTGSNLRATAPLLTDAQSWTLVDHDRLLLEAARGALGRWAEQATTCGETMILVQAGKRLEVRFRQADLAHDLDAALGASPQLVTTSALFDLCSAQFMKTFANAVAQRHAVVYAVLTYNGIQRWTPRQPVDNAMVGAFHAHQTTDKGFGGAAGPAAPAHLADALRLAGYSVLEGNSSWRLGPGDAKLIDELAAGLSHAVAQTGMVEAKTIDRWNKVAHTGVEVGHTDTLAFPG